jgi:prevent-host-death family protein
MVVSSTELQNNFGKYLELVASAGNQIVITRNGAVVGRLIGKNTVVSFLADRLVGLVPPDVLESESKSERLARQ